MATNWSAKRLKIYRSIIKHGQSATLRRSSGDRTCYVVEVFFSANQIDGVLIQREDKHYLMSPLISETTLLSPDPDQNLDSLILFPQDTGSSDELIFAAPPVKFSPGGLNLYWDLHMRTR